MSSNHTAAPWSIGSLAFRESTKDSGGYNIVGSNGQGFAYTVGLGNPEDIANARLIAAAPDLLLACERALQIIEDDRANFVQCVTYSKGIEKEGKNIVDGYDAVIGIVQSAIAKTKGGEA